MHHWERRYESGMLVRSYPGESRDTILFIHGFGAWSGAWAKIAGHPALARFRKLAPDLPGHGMSGPCPDGMSHGGIVEVLADWLRAWEEGPVFLVGHSMGGVVAQMLAERHPELVRALIDVEGNISRDDCYISGKVAGQTAEEFVRAGHAQLQLEIYRAGHSDQALRDYFVGMSMAEPRTLHALAGELVEMSEREDLAARLRALPIRTRYVGGQPGGIGNRSVNLLQQAGVDTVILSPSGHVPFEDQPDEFAKAVVETFH